MERVKHFDIVTFDLEIHKERDENIERGIEKQCIVTSVYGRCSDLETDEEFYGQSWAGYKW